MFDLIALHDVAKIKGFLLEGDDRAILFYFCFRIIGFALSISAERTAEDQDEKQILFHTAFFLTNLIRKNMANESKSGPKPVGKSDDLPPIDNLWGQNVTGMDKDVAKTYGNQVRVRVCGLCWDDERLLMVNHHGITASDFWAPPGGGIEFGETIEATLRREFAEETGLLIDVGEFRFGCEFIGQPLHAIELFYNVTVRAGSPRRGADPEMQIISDVRFMSFEDLNRVPGHELHGIFRALRSPADLKRLRGFFRI